ncbi:MAG: hypothetical protein AB1476_03660 [Candidatus Hadarchaeota archaeon]
MAATTIKIHSDTASTLRKLGDKGMTYDEIINEVVSGYLAFVDELYQRANEPVVGRPLREVMDELESDTSPRRRR